MNYYSELGVKHDASEREIRQAYRVLVRLLHPDTQTGDDLRLAAERQLIRLNEMFAVLMNVDTRRAYDLSLEQDWSQRNHGVPPSSMASRSSPLADVSAVAREASLVAQFALRYWALILIGAVILGAAALSALLHGNSEVVAPPQTADVQPHSHPPVATRIVARLRRLSGACLIRQLRSSHHQRSHRPPAVRAHWTVSCPPRKPRFRQPVLRPRCPNHWKQEATRSR